jgi:hypothetical protein
MTAYVLRDGDEINLVDPLVAGENRAAAGGEPGTAAVAQVVSI